MVFLKEFDPMQAKFRGAAVTNTFHDFSQKD